MNGEPDGAVDVAATTATTAANAGSVLGYARVGGLSRFVRRFRRQRAGIVALGFLLFLVVVAVAAPLLAPADPDAQSLTMRLEYPSSSHVLGTDDLGRDNLSRLIFATRISLQAAVLAVGIGLSLGVPLGLIAGYRRGWTDAVISRIVDAVMSIPPLVLAIAIIGVLGPNLRNAMLAVGLAYAPRLFRLTRATTMSVREELFIEASIAAGCSPLRVMVRHIWPNVLPPLLVQISLMMGFAILAESGLSFLGLGVQPPQASWGAMLGRAYRDIHDAPLLIFFPGVAIMATVLAFNVFGDGLRDAIGREMRRER